MKRRAFFRTLTGGLLGIKMGFSSKGNKKSSLKKGFNKTEKSDVVVQVLGTAQDGGVPQIGCYCPNCKRARKNQKHARLISSLAILDPAEKKYFILDPSPDLRVQWEMAHERMGFEKKGKRNLPDGLLISHAHIGHYTGLMFYGYEVLSAENMPVYCSDRMGRFLSANGPWNQLIDLKNISLKITPPGRKFTLTKNISVIPFYVPHREEYSDTFGFIISGKRRKLMYIPDIQKWNVWERSIVDEVEKVNTALLDGTFFSRDELPGRDLSKIGHPFITESMAILKKTVSEGKSQVYFTHLNHSNPALDPEGEARIQIKKAGFEVAEDGMEFHL
jgi:pyrroloquinoline quinone biosynthesis protein B